MKLKKKRVNGGVKTTRLLVFLLQGQNALKSNYKTIDCGYIKKRFLNVPVSIDFQHTIAPHRPKVTEDYHISTYEDLSRDGYIFRFVLGIRNMRIAIFVDRAAILISKMKTDEYLSLILNHRIADIIRENKKRLYAELMQWANQFNFGEVE